MVLKASQKACNQIAKVKEKDMNPITTEARLIDGRAAISFVERETHGRQCVACRMEGYLNWGRK